MQHQASLLQANLFAIKKGMKEVSLSDWNQNGKMITVPLDPHKLPHEQINKLFKSSRKLRVGVPHAQRLLAEAESALEKSTQEMSLVEGVKDMEELEALIVQFDLVSPHEKAIEKRRLPPEPAKPYKEFLSSVGERIWVGKSDRENDKLSFHHANGSDWWFHAHNYPGSHVVIHLGKDQDPHEETVKDAAELALRYSKAKHQVEGEVTVTQAKWLKPVKGVPGKVMVSKHRVLRVRLSEERWNRLRNGKAN